MFGSGGGLGVTAARATVGIVGCAFWLASLSPGARADENQPLVPVAPPPIPRRAFLQYGVAFTVEGVVTPGPMCSDQANPCILGSGGGIAVRVGFRPTERLYLGSAYELSKQEPDKLYRLGILQQARFELRRYFPTGHQTTPFVLLGLGIAGYGNEWQVDTWGPGAVLGGGLEMEVSDSLLLDVGLSYRPVYFRRFVDSSTLLHDAGVAQFIGLELAVEAQEGL